MSYTIHFCLISKQAAPNLLPILDKSFKPKSAVFIVSKEMKKQAEYLSQVFKKQNIEVKLVNLEDEFNFSKTSEQLLELVSEYENENIALNVTGGTKLISIAAADAFNLIGKPIFYIDTKQNNIIFLSKDENKNWIENKELSTKIKIETYLAAYGNQLMNKQQRINKDILNAMSILICDYDKYKNALPKLNWASSQAKGTLRYKCGDDIKISVFRSLLNFLHSKNIITLKGDIIDFKNEETRIALNGGWLEDYVFEQVRGIKKVDDILENAEIANENYEKNKGDFAQKNKGNKNEFDVLFLSKNILHLIECKTQTFRSEEKNQKAEDILYKLETLKDYGGLMTKKCLVSYFEVSEAIMNRARALEIKVIQGKNIARIKQIIQEWISYA